MDHETDCSCKACAEGLGSAIASEIKATEKYGWYTHYVMGAENLTGFDAHTHGLEKKYGHPDFQIVIALPISTLRNIFWTFVNRIKEGERFEHGQKYDKIIANMPVQLAWTRTGGRRLLRVVLPDRSGNVAIGLISGDFALQWAEAEAP